MKRLIAAVLFSTAAIVSAAVPPPAVYDIEANFQQVQELPEQEFVQGASAVLRYRLKSGGKWLDLSGLGARWDARATGTSTQALQATASVYTNATPHYFSIPLNSTQTGTARSNWLYSVIVTLDGADYPLGQGRLDIEASAWTGASAILSTVTAASYTDAAVSNHAAIMATTNSAGHVIIGAGLQIADGVLSSSAGAPAWSAVTDKPTTFPPHLSATQSIIRASGSGGLVIQNMAGSNVVSFGLADTLNAAFIGGLSVAGNLLVGGTNLLTQIEGKAPTGTVAAIDTRVAGVETGKVDRTDTRYQASLTNETDTLQSVVARGNIVTNKIQLGSYFENTGSILEIRTGTIGQYGNQGLYMIVDNSEQAAISLVANTDGLYDYWWSMGGRLEVEGQLKAGEFLGAHVGSGIGITNLPALSSVSPIAPAATNLLSFTGPNSISLTGTSARIIGMEIPTASANEGWLSVYVSTTNSVTYLTNQPHLSYPITVPTSRVQTVLYYLPAGSTNITGRVFQ